MQALEVRANPEPPGPPTRPDRLNGLGIMPGDTLIICGAASNVCVHYTRAVANQRDYHIRVVEDGCAGGSIEEHEAAMRQINYLQHGARINCEEALKIINE